jgi:hypothetical protein
VVASPKSRRFLRQFVEQGWEVLEPGTQFIPGLHVDAVCEHLQAMIEKAAIR